MAQRKKQPESEEIKPNEAQQKKQPERKRIKPNEASSSTLVNVEVVKSYGVSKEGDKKEMSEGNAKVLEQKGFVKII